MVSRTVVFDGAEGSLLGVSTAEEPPLLPPREEREVRKGGEGEQSARRSRMRERGRRIGDVAGAIFGERTSQRGFIEARWRW